MNSEKWDKYHEQALKDGSSPPWESDEPFHFIKQLISTNTILKQGLSIVDLGCGSSETAIYLAKSGLRVTAIDISSIGPPFIFIALERAQMKPNSELVQWVQADILSNDLFHIVKSLDYDVVFDMQCFQVLRTIDEARAVQVIHTLLKPGGYAIIVTGASLTEHSSENTSGPALLTKVQLEIPFTNHNFELVSI